MHISVLICFLCGLLFFGIGVWASKQKTAFSFYAGITPKSVRDVSGYNRACGRMLKWYSLPWFLCAGAGLWLGDSVWMFFLIMLAAIPGSICLLIAYSRIEKAYRA